MRVLPDVELLVELEEEVSAEGEPAVAVLPRNPPFAVRAPDPPGAVRPSRFE